ncbi:flavin reductase family protein [Pseudonocardia xishanensis]|uniref:Flavin reductase family protein n=1 Tax=Pseudonocardia xishanensis TaxID=630995 RepID=A0ABP8S0Y5_9PSEU
MTGELDRAELRRTFAHFPSGVVAVCAQVDGTPVGMAASSFTSVSLVPPLVSVCVDHGSTTWPVLQSAGVLGISVLSAEQAAAGRQLSRRGVDRFEGVRLRHAPSGAVLVEGAAAWLECRVDDVVLAGDHDIVVMEVTRTATNGGDPLVFHDSRFRRLEVG